MTSSSRLLSRVSILPLALLFGSCGDGDRTPSSPASPSPSATPVAPAPTPTPAARTNCERIGMGTGTGVNCPRQSPSFQTEVDEAIAKLRADRPDLFEGRNVLSIGQYLLGVTANLEAMGLCASFDGEEMQVKNSNDFNDQYHILTSGQQYRDGTGSYRVTCYPAAFPTPSAPPPQRAPGCSLNLPPSRDIGCGRENAAFLPLVDAAIQKVADEHPEILDKSQVSGGQGWYKILNPDAYFNAVVSNLQARGVCAWYDGEELAVKNANTFSDQYDILAGEWPGFTRRGEGSYRTTCYPAAF
ncbi:MAG TPA: hypothetical protein VIG50_13075 [Vicinamibacteria bacterium]